MYMNCSSGLKYNNYNNIEIKDIKDEYFHIRSAAYIKNLRWDRYTKFNFLVIVIRYHVYKSRLMLHITCFFFYHT